MSKRNEKQKSGSIVNTVTKVAKVKPEIKDTVNIAICVICHEKFILAGAPVLTCGKRDCVIQASRMGLFEEDKKKRELERQKSLEKYEQSLIMR